MNAQSTKTRRNYLMAWHDSTASVIEQLSAMPYEVLEEAMDLHLKRCEEYEDQDLCPACGQMYSWEASPAQGCYPGSGNLKEKVCNYRDCHL